MRRTVPLVLAALAAGTSLLSTAGSAGATAAPDLRPRSHATRVPDPVCETARAATRTAGTCGAENVVGVGPARPLTAAELVEYGNLQSADGTTVAQAAAAGRV